MGVSRADSEHVRQDTDALAATLGGSFALVDAEDVAQVCEARPGEVQIRTVHASVWRRAAHPEIQAADA
jgi:hypothetical protein